MAQLRTREPEYGTAAADPEYARPWPKWTCPTDGLPLRDGGTAFVCGGGHEFPVVAGVPRFVPGTTYADHFGEQWKRYRLTQLDSYTGVPISEDRLARCFGAQLWNRLPGLHVLECGC